MSSVVWPEHVDMIACCHILSCTRRTDKKRQEQELGPVVKEWFITYAAISAVILLFEDHPVCVDHNQAHHDMPAAPKYAS